MLLTDNRNAGRRETETVITVTTVIPNVIQTDAVDDQFRQ